MMPLSTQTRRSGEPPGPHQRDAAGFSGEFPRGFEPLSLAAEGGFCELWQVRDVHSREMLALKRLRPERRHDVGARALVAHEWQVASGIDSPHVAKCVGGDADCEQPYIVLEWLDGLTLEQKLLEGARLPARRSVWIARQCAQGLADLAGEGFSHGDVKPANVFLTARGPAKLIDLGFARPLKADALPAPERRMMGTADYMAPEELARGPFPPVLKDLYSLGVMLFRMLAGRLPFFAESAAEMLRLQRQARPPRLADCCPHVTPRLDDLVGRLLAKQPIRRPQSHAALIRELVELELESMP